MAPEATVCLKRLASMLSDKREESYPTVMGWLRCAISSLLRSSLACLRGSDQERQRPNTNDSRRMRGNSIGRTLNFKASYSNTFHRSTIHFAIHCSLLSNYLSNYAPIPLPSSALISLLRLVSFGCVFSLTIDPLGRETHVQSM